MKKILSYFLATILMVSIFSSGPNLVVHAAEANTVVYVTNTGECYHSANCSSLRKSKIEITLAEAVNYYRPCSKCHPPKLDSTTSTTNVKTSAAGMVKQSVSTTDNVGKVVWLSATGSKYHSKNNCGTMDPDRAVQVTESEAQNSGKSKCSKCWK